jgi:TRAP-type C4-dicarboxylate transport system substrate-binding protein
MAPTILMTRKTPVRTLDDMLGLKVRTSSPIESELIQAWGGVPVAMPITEAYNALNTGVVDAVLIQPGALYRPWNLSEPTRYVTDNLPSPTSVVFLAMNQKTWQSLPKAQQVVLDQLTGREFSIKASNLWAAEHMDALKRCRQTDAGTEYIGLTSEQRGAFARAARPTVDKALDKLDKAGIDGRVIYNALQP